MLTLSEIIGQTTVIGLLKSVIQRQQPSHAYLFHGPDAVGRATGAFAFARALLCHQPTPEGDACGRCMSCHKMEALNHPDFRLVGIQRSGAGTTNGDHWRISIDQIRQNPTKPRVTPPPMITDAYYHPIESAWKVYVIEPADLLSPDAAGALLKLLEEPPDYVVIILVTSRLGMILPTLRSRCWSVGFRLVARDLIQQALVNNGTEDSRARLFAALAEGRIGWAIANVGKDEIDQARRSTIELLAQITSSPKSEALRLAEALREIAQETYAEELADKTGAGEEPSTAGYSGMEGERKLRNALPLILDLGISWYRDLLLVSQRADMLVANDDYRELLSEQAEYLQIERIKSGIISLLETKSLVARFANPTLMAENLVLKLQS